MTGLGRVLLTALALVALSAGALAGCGGDDDGGASPADLADRLLPSSELSGFKVERRLEWDNATDAAHEGLPLPETTPLSRAVEVFEDAGFEAGVGKRLVVAEGESFEGPQATVRVMQLGSEENAREVLEFASSEALKQPCFAVCSVEGRRFPVAGIPGARGTQLSPLREPPPDAPPPFEAYAIGFTVGPRLFLVDSGGAPGQAKKEQVVRAAKALYERDSKSGAGA